jgi:hypothetical protein
MRDPFDTGPVLRLGEAKAVVPEPEVDRLQVDTTKLTKIKIEAALFSEEDRKARRSPRFNVSIPAAVTVDDFKKAIEKVMNRNGVVCVTPEQIAALAGNLFHSTLPAHRRSMDLFTAAFAPRINYGDTSSEALRANHIALVTAPAPFFPGDPINFDEDELE